jgi:hypothetical protein
MKTTPLFRRVSPVTALLASLAFVSEGATLQLTPSRDTSLMEIAPDNNTGGMLNLVSGSVANGKKTRALIRFDVSGALPDGAVIESATLKLTVLKAPPGAVSPASRFGLHRVLVDWIEGSKAVSNTGDRGTDGEPTWSMRSVGSEPWSEPGGALDDVEFASAVSSDIEMDLPGNYTIPSTAALVADVQSWICRPDSNFGWVLVSNREEAAATARRLGSKESTPSQVPTLTLAYSISTPEIRITQLELNEGSLVLGWTGNASEYQVQQRLSIDGPWTDLGAPVGCERTTRVPTSEQVAFLRVVSR